MGEAGSTPILALSTTSKVLVLALLLTFVGTILLTPAGFETRPVASIHPAGLAVLLLVFVAVALNLSALLLIARRPRWAARLAAFGPFLFAPAFAVDQSGNFSPFGPPLRITIVEYAQLSLEIAAGLLALLVYRETVRARDRGTPGEPG